MKKISSPLEEITLEKINRYLWSKGWESCKVFNSKDGGFVVHRKMYEDYRVREVECPLDRRGGSFMIAVLVRDLSRFEGKAAHEVVEDIIHLGTGADR